MNTSTMNVGQETPIGATGEPVNLPSRDREGVVTGKDF